MFQIILCIHILEYGRSNAAWENSRHLATPPLISSRSDVLETSAEIPYWWRVTTQIWVVHLIGWNKLQPIKSTTQCTVFFSCRSFSEAGYRVFSHEVTAAMLMFLSNKTTPMSVSQTSPLVVELVSSVNAFFCSNEFSQIVAAWQRFVLSFQKKLNEVRS